MVMMMMTMVMVMAMVTKTDSVTKGPDVIRQDIKFLVSDFRAGLSQK